MSNNISTEFWKLCDAAHEKEKVSNGPDEFETEMLGILNLIKSNPLSKTLFIEYLTKILKNNKKWPQEIVEYSMRELQWIELKKIAVRIIEENTDYRVKRWMEIFLEVYEKEWEDSELYEYYK